MKIAVKPAITSSAEGTRPKSSRFLALSTPASVPSDAAQARRKARYPTANVRADGGLAHVSIQL
jgi:hypothetical protein